MLSQRLLKLNFALLIRGNGLRLLAVALAIGLALRVVGFVNRPSLGLDEARLALNIGARSYGGLLARLGHDQSAPALFLWAEKAITDVFGVSDLTLRVLPLAAGIAAMLLVYPLFNRVLGAAAAGVGASVIAFAPVFVYYSTSIKQYGVEVLVTLVLLYLALDWFGYGRSPSRGVALAVLGVLAPWLSAPAVFSVGSVIVALLWVGIVRSEGRSRLLAQRIIPLWVGSAALAYFVTYREAAKNPYLQRYWEGAFLTPEHGNAFATLSAIGKEMFWGLAIGYPGALSEIIPDVVLTIGSWAVLVLMVVGLGYIGQRFRGEGVLLVSAPVVAMFSASALGYYPVALRLMLFAAPLGMLAVLAGFDRVIRRMASVRRTSIWAVVSAIALLPLLSVSFLQSTSANPPEHLRPLVAELKRLRALGEPVYIFAGSIPSWAFYSTNWSDPDRQRLMQIEEWASSGGAAFENAPSRPGPVSDEGDSLRYPTPAGLELYGVSTGIEWKPIYGVGRRTTDLSWADNEARRISIAAPSGVWVLMSHAVGNEADLFDELERRGWRATNVRVLNDATLRRYELVRASN